MRSDLEIARDYRLEPIGEVAGRFGILDSELLLYGPWKAKVDARAMTARLADRPRGKYIDVTAVTPTPLGEGKTVTTIGLGLALNRIGKKAIITIRQPSMGPVFGVKGGAAGGGHSQVVPMEDFNLHLTGDMHAVSAAHNLLAAWVDSSILLKNPFGLNPEKVTYRRVVDINDRALREIEVGLGGKKNGVPRLTGFDITPASEVMAILGLSRDIFDLRARLGRIIVGEDHEGRPVTAETLECAGAMAAILKDAVNPTVMQTNEGTIAFVHAGPFANIAYGNSSVIADQIATRLADYTVTESGFGADMGFEKLCNIKARASGITPDAAVVVVTVRALKAHCDRFDIKAGKPLDPGLFEKDVAAIDAGLPNLRRHIANVRAHGIPVVVAINRFGNDNEEELAYVRAKALEFGADAAELSEVHGRGGVGGEALALAVVAAAEKGARFQHGYELEDSIENKIRTLATRFYGAAEIELAEAARESIERIEAWGFGNLPICMAKTHLSISHDPTLKGAPEGYLFPVRGVRLAAGAGFVYPLAGDMMLMPGLGSRPALRSIDIDENGQVQGLF
ncbi:MAG: formate--tetrahydrofolate ligase [Planctomycetes bacterium]|nr:formate--tetrahydrofolate ligase [Planctomycetota bacterium]